MLTSQDTSSFQGYWNEYPSVVSMKPHRRQKVGAQARAAAGLTLLFLGIDGEPALRMDSKPLLLGRWSAEVTVVDLVWAATF